ncbi:unnamed protein product [Brassica rapa]|uniref:Uncharacterized protein n=2 Tax=Brassica TaxID=3705 RepID=A0A3P5ZBZ3_BRACM|nr:unnamed protein product [Brassica napus]CAG7876478.1 unnamed protein product [Brassica rapa]CDY26916.1 BnaA05g17960D [Brassica napus]VDC71633.1 unnamed protein product [Brassica rapa]
MIFDRLTNSLLTSTKKNLCFFRVSLSRVTTSTENSGGAISDQELPSSYLTPSTSPLSQPPSISTFPPQVAIVSLSSMASSSDMRKDSLRLYEVGKTQFRI